MDLNKLQHLWARTPRRVKWIAGAAVALALFVRVAAPEETAPQPPPPEMASGPSDPPQQPAPADGQMPPASEDPRTPPAPVEQPGPTEAHTPSAPTEPQAPPATAGPQPPALPAGESARVTHVVDGDTIEVELNGVEEKVRLIGVDTPEVYGGAEPYGPEASAFTKSRLAGQSVVLEFDVEERDRYGRLLAYVWLGEEMFNETLLREGYAQVMTVPPNVRHADRFVALQREAREAGRGLWAPSEGPDECRVKGNISASGEKIYHVQGGAFYERTQPEACFDTPAEAEAAGYRASKR